MVVSVREFLFVTVGSVVLSLVVLGVLWPWARQVRRLAVIAKPDDRWQERPLACDRGDG